jgi:polar amino acid transport system substrate-binding protein
LLVLVTLGLTACGTSSTAGGGTVTPPPDSDLFAAGTLTIGSDVSYPPQEFFDPPGSTTATGFDIDVGKALAAKMGLKFNTVNQTFDGIIPALTAKKYDVILSAMSVTDERKKTVDFVPYFTSGESFVVLKTATYKPTKLADLCGHKVAVEDGTTEQDDANGLNAAGKPCADKHAIVTVFKTDDKALPELRKGASVQEVHFTDTPVAHYELAHASDLAISGASIPTGPEGIAVRKGDTAMLTAIKAAFKALEDDGTYKDLLKKWSLEDGDITKSA